MRKLSAVCSVIVADADCLESTAPAHLQGGSALASRDLEGRSERQWPASSDCVQGLPVGAGTESGSRPRLPKRPRLVEAAIAIKAPISSKNIRIALINDGKLSAARSIALTHSMGCDSVDIGFVSEAAHAGKSALITEPGYAWATPLQQRKAGSGFIFKESLLGQRKAQIKQDDNNHWSLASFLSPCGATLVAAYITPAAHKLPGITKTFLEFLSQRTPKGKPCVVGGDFNAPAGSPQRLLVDAWAVREGLTLVNPGMITHWMRADSAGTDLDLLFVRGRSAKLVSSDRPQAGHATLIFDVESDAHLRWTPPAQKIAWKKLAENAEEFIAGVEMKLLSEPKLTVCEIIKQVAPETLGYVVPGRVQLPPRVRRKVRALRRLCKKHLRGSPEHTALTHELGEILQHYRVKAWKQKLLRIGAEPGICQEAWQLARNLRANHKATRHVGIPDIDVASAYQAVYSSNSTRRPDWEHQRVAPEIVYVEGKPPPIESPFTADEVGLTLAKLPNGKAPGVDGIPHEAFKILRGSKYAMQALARQYSHYLEHGYKEQITSRLVVIPKKGIPDGPLDMRPLMMLPTERKILELLMARRIHDFAKLNGWDGMYYLQGGFRHDMNIERQILLAELAIIDARRNARELRIVALDLVKAFDKIPKEFTTHCAVSLLGEGCPRFSRLVSEVAQSQVTASIGSERFPVVTGVPQGGILSPWLFICAMNDLAVRLKHAGFSLSNDAPRGSSNGTFLGTLLYADDVLLLDSSASEGNSRCRIVEDWVHEWGGQLNAKKTQWFSINGSPADSGPSIEDMVFLDADSKVDYLGAFLTPSGVRLKYTANEFDSVLGKLTSLTRVDGLCPWQCLQMIRAVAWPKISIGANIVLPDPAEFVRKFHASARSIFNCYDTTHGAEMQRELGYLFSPFWWIIKAAVTFYSEWHKAKRDKTTAAILKALPPDHPIRTRLAVLLKPIKIGWEEFATCSTADLVRRAQALCREYIRKEIIDEATRLGLYDRTDLAWSEERDKPAKYLKEENARYGFVFRLHSLGPGNQEIDKCLFCGQERSDTGRHLLFNCSAARAAAPLPTALAKLPEAKLLPALRLSDTVPSERRCIALAYCKTLWTLRGDLRVVKRPPKTAHTGKRSNRHFLSTAKPETTADGKREPGMESQLEVFIDDPDTKEEFADGAPRPAKRPKPGLRSGSWSHSEDEKLLSAIRSVGRGNVKELAALVITRSATQVRSHLETGIFKALELASSRRISNPLFPVVTAASIAASDGPPAAGAAAAASVPAMEPAAADTVPTSPASDSSPPRITEKSQDSESPADTVTTYDNSSPTTPAETGGVSSPGSSSSISPSRVLPLIVPAPPSSSIATPLKSGKWTEDESSRLACLVLRLKTQDHDLIHANFTGRSVDQIRRHIGTEKFGRILLALQKAALSNPHPPLSVASTVPASSHVDPLQDSAPISAIFGPSCAGISQSVSSPPARPGDVKQDPAATSCTVEPCAGTTPVYLSTVVSACSASGSVPSEFSQVSAILPEHDPSSQLVTDFLGPGLLSQLDLSQAGWISPLRPLDSLHPLSPVRASSGTDHLLPDTPAFRHTDWIVSEDTPGTGNMEFSGGNDSLNAALNFVGFCAAGLAEPAALLLSLTAVQDDSGYLADLAPTDSDSIPGAIPGAFSSSVSPNQQLVFFPPAAAEGENSSHCATSATTIQDSRSAGLLSLPASVFVRLPLPTVTEESTPGSEASSFKPEFHAGDPIVTVSRHQGLSLEATVSASAPGVGDPFVPDASSDFAGCTPGSLSRLTQSHPGWIIASSALAGPPAVYDSPNTHTASPLVAAIVPGSCSPAVSPYLAWSVASPDVSAELQEVFDDADSAILELDLRPGAVPSMSPAQLVASRYQHPLVRSRPDLRRIRRLSSDNSGAAASPPLQQPRRSSRLSVAGPAPCTSSNRWTRQQSEILASAILSRTDLEQACALLPGKTRAQCLAHQRTKAFKAVLKHFALEPIRRSNFTAPVVTELVPRPEIEVAGDVSVLHSPHDDGSSTQLFAFTDVPDSASPFAVVSTNQAFSTDSVICTSSSHPALTLASPFAEAEQAAASISPASDEIPAASSLMILTLLDSSVASPTEVSTAKESVTDAEVRTSDPAVLLADDSGSTSMRSLTSRWPGRRGSHRPDLQRTRRIASAIAGSADPLRLPQRQSCSRTLSSPCSAVSASRIWTQQQSDILASAALAHMDSDTAYALLSCKTRTQCLLHKRTKAFKAALKRLAEASIRRSGFSAAAVRDSVCCLPPSIAGDLSPFNASHGDGPLAEHYAVTAAAAPLSPAVVPEVLSLSQLDDCLSRLLSPAEFERYINRALVAAEQASFSHSGVPMLFSEPAPNLGSPLADVEPEPVLVSLESKPLPGEHSLMNLTLLDSPITCLPTAQSPEESITDAAVVTMEPAVILAADSSSISLNSLVSRSLGRRGFHRPDLQRTRRIASAIAGSAYLARLKQPNPSSKFSAVSDSQSWTPQQTGILASAALAHMDLDTACALLPCKTRTQCLVHKRTKAFKAAFKRLAAASIRRSGFSAPVVTELVPFEPQPAHTSSAVLEPVAAVSLAPAGLVCPLTLPSTPPTSPSPASLDLTSRCDSDCSGKHSHSGFEHDDSPNDSDSDSEPPSAAAVRGPADPAPLVSSTPSDARRGFQSLFGNSSISLLPLPIQRIREPRTIVSIVPSSVGVSRKRASDDAAALPNHKRARQDDRWTSRSRWTAAETAALVAAVQEIGLGNNDGLATRVGTKTAGQCSDHLRAAHVKRHLAGESLAAARTTQGFVSRHWTDAEHSRLLDALNSHERFNPARLQAAVGSRSADQVNRKVDQLLESGAIARGSNGLFHFTRDMRQRAPRQQPVDPLTALLGSDFFSASSGATATSLAAGALPADDPSTASPAAESAPTGCPSDSSSAVRFDSSGSRDSSVSLPAEPRSVFAPEIPLLSPSLAGPSRPAPSPASGVHQRPAPAFLKPKYSTWTRAEDMALLAAFREFGPGKNKEFASRVTTKTPGQCAERLRARAFRDQLVAAGLGPSTGPAPRR